VSAASSFFTSLTFPDLIRAAVTFIVLTVATRVLANADANTQQRQWATGAVALILGYWLHL
jgi:hypothetical protein